jgi:hypothetical protein
MLFFLILPCRQERYFTMGTSLKKGQSCHVPVKTQNPPFHKTRFFTKIATALTAHGKQSGLMKWKSAASDVNGVNTEAEGAPR